MNTIKISDLYIGYSDEVKNIKGVLNETVKFLWDIKTELLKINNIPTEDSEYKKYVNKYKTQIGYAYHGEDIHEFVIIEIKNGNQQILDRVYCEIDIVEDEGFYNISFLVFENDNIAKYSNVKRVITVDKGGRNIKIFDHISMLNSILDN